MYPGSVQQAKEMIEAVYPDLRDTKMTSATQLETKRGYVFLTAGEAIKISAAARSDWRIRAEAQALRALSGMPALRVSRLTGYSAEGKIVRMTRLPGNPLVSSLKDEFRQLSAPPPAEQEDTGRRIGRFLAALHDVPLTSEDKQNMSLAESFAHYGIRSRDKVEDFGHLLRGRDRLRLARAAEYLDAFPRLRDHAALLHMDLNPTNLLKDERDGGFNIIDFGLSGVCHAHMDFVRPAAFFPPAITRTIIKSYEAETGRKVDSQVLQGALDTRYITRMASYHAEGCKPPHKTKPVTLKL